MKVALAQMDIIFGEVKENIKKVESFVKEASKNEVDLVLFPEMCLSGFDNNIELLNNSEEEILNWISNLALKNYINIGIGYGVKLQEKGANKFSIVSKEGKNILNYTKIHPFSMADEDKFFYSGNEIKYCSINGINISSFICYDLRFPYLFQKASQKSYLITVAANWPKDRKEHWITLLKARAIENQCFIAAVNKVFEGNGLYYSGDSMIIDPFGNVIAYGSNYEGLIIGEIDFSEVKKCRSSMNIIGDRKEIE